MNQTPLILLVEDDEADVFLFLYRIKEYGLDLEVDVASSAPEARRLQQRALGEGRRYEVVVVDEYLAGDEVGSELAEEIKTDPYWRGPRGVSPLVIHRTGDVDMQAARPDVISKDSEGPDTFEMLATLARNHMALARAAVTVASMGMV